MTAETVQFLHHLLLALQQHSAQRRQRAGITATEYAALHELSHRPDGLTPSQIGSRLAVTTGGVTKLIDRLERRRLAKRTRDTADRRSITVVATRRGQALIRADLEELLDSLPHADAQLSPAERETAERLITLLRADSSR